MPYINEFGVKAYWIDEVEPKELQFLCLKELAPFDRLPKWLREFLSTRPMGPVRKELDEYYDLCRLYPQKVVIERVLANEASRIQFRLMKGTLKPELMCREMKENPFLAASMRKYET